MDQSRHWDRAVKHEFNPLNSVATNDEDIVTIDLYDDDKVEDVGVVEETKFDIFWKKISIYMPLIYVFLSGIGFSIQSLFVKLLSEEGFHGSFEIVFSRGLIQLMISSLVIHFDKSENKPSICGDSTYVTWILFLRSVIGFGGIAFSFMAVELLPIGDATVLVMLSPFCASFLSIFIIGETWKLKEFIGAMVSLLGATLVAKPQFLFGGAGTNSLGVIYSLLGSLTAGGAYVTVRMLGTVVKMPWSNVCWAQAWGQVLLSIPSLILAGQTFSADLTAAQFALIFFGGFIGAFSQIAMTIGMQREKSSLATMMRMSDIIFGYIWQILFTDDRISGLSIFGAILVTCSVFFILGLKAPNKPDTAVAELGDETTNKMIELANESIDVNHDKSHRKTNARNDYLDDVSKPVDLDLETECHLEYRSVAKDEVSA